MAELTPDPTDPEERARRRRLLGITLILLIGLPIYLIVAALIMGALTAPVVGPEGELVSAKPLHWTLELLVYVGLGLVWAFPLKRLVMGVGKKRA